MAQILKHRGCLSTLVGFSVYCYKKMVKVISYLKKKRVHVEFHKTIQKHLFHHSNENFKVPDDGIADIEDALTFTEFGKFNLLMMAYSIPASMAIIFDTTTMSFTITSAECDLKLSYMHKGLLNAMSPLGMISCAFLSGFITDTLGRRNTLVYGFLLNGLINLISSFSNSYQMLAILKFLAGFIICGPCTIVLSCLSEFFSKHVRPMFVMYIGMCLSLGSLIIPFVAWGALENPVDFYVSSKFVVHSWQIFLAICSLPSLLSGFFAIIIPESPRFLTAMGRLDEALNVLKKVYVINTGRSVDTYPIKQLSSKYVSSKDIKHTDGEKGYLTALRNGISQMKPLFQKPHICNLLVAFVIIYGIMTGFTLRLWLPQLFKMMTESSKNETNSMCEMISLGNNTNIVEPIFFKFVNCTPIPIHSETFKNTAIVAGIQILLGGISSLIIDIIGKRTLLMITLFIAGMVCSAMFLCITALQATALSSIVIAFSAIASSAIISVFIDLIPTTLRATATSCILTVGRIGSIIGSMVFPILLALGCLPAFLSIGCLLIGCSLFTFLIPKPKKDIL